MNSTKGSTQIPFKITESAHNGGFAPNDNVIEPCLSMCFILPDNFPQAPFYAIAHNSITNTLGDRKSNSRTTVIAALPALQDETGSNPF